MNARTLHDVLHDAGAQGLLPADTALPADEGRPWPVVLLTALGAWLATVPLLGVIGLLLGDLLQRDVGPYLVGTLLIGAAVVVLRSRDLPLFVEQLAIPALLTGGGSLGFGLFRDLHTSAAALLLALVALGVAAALRAAWLRLLLGAAAATLFAVALAFEPRRVFDGMAPQPWWLAWHLVLGIALLAQWLPRRAALAAVLEPTAAGALLAALAGLAWWSGMSFLVGGSLAGFAGEVAQELGRRPAAPVPWWHGLQAASALLAASAAAWSLRRWASLRHAAFVAAALVLVALSFFLPALGAVLLALAACATSARWRLAAAAGVAAAWSIGAFYYQLAWPLSTKALVLAGAGAALALLAAWVVQRDQHAAPKPDTPAAAPSAGRGARLGIALSLLAVLAVANVGIVQKEQLIRDGRPVFVALAPVDPRSLMQGDYMRLNFSLPIGVDERRDGLLRAQRPHVVATLDARGIATLQRIDDGRPLAAGEQRIELTPKDGQWTLVSDAWFFAEGEAPRWAKARYGEFRVDARGHALLVGLRGPDLETL